MLSFILLIVLAFIALKLKFGLLNLFLFYSFSYALLSLSLSFNSLVLEWYLCNNPIDSLSASILSRLSLLFLNNFMSFYSLSLSVTYLYLKLWYSSLDSTPVYCLNEELIFSLLSVLSSCFNLFGSNKFASLIEEDTFHLLIFCHSKYCFLFSTYSLQVGIIFKFCS